MWPSLWWVFLALLVAIECLQVFWSQFLVHAILLAAQGKEVEDARSDDEGEDSGGQKATESGGKHPSKDE